MNKKTASFILALLVADAILDALFLSAVLSAEDEETETDKDGVDPLIGRLYAPNTDKAVDVATGINVGDSLNGKKFPITKEPYEWNDDLCVNVFSPNSARDYRVPFRENCIVE